MNRENTRRLILASSSPRRKSLMQEAGYAFDVVEPSDGAECGQCSGESPAEFVARLAYQKAKDVAKRIDDGIVIGADTVAVCQGQILGKPRDQDHASSMLQLMRSREHFVYTGICLWSRPDDRVTVEFDRTTLQMDPVSDDQLDEYLETGNWEGKAGAFGYQDGHDWIHIIDGSESNVVGLPIEKLEHLINQVLER